MEGNTKEMQVLKPYVDKSLMMVLDLNIPIGAVTEWKINTRAKNIWGQTRKHPNGTFTIEISSMLLEDGVRETEILDTIIHELLHTCDGCMNHKSLWKAYAAKVNQAYGMSISRCANYEEMGIKRDMSIYKYAIQCQGCGNIIHFQRLSKSVQNPDAYRCTICHGNFKRIK